MPTITTKFEIGDTVKVVEGAYRDYNIVGKIEKISWWKDAGPYYFVKSGSAFSSGNFLEDTLELYEDTATDEEVDDLEKRLGYVLGPDIKVPIKTLKRIIARMDKAESELLDLRIKTELGQSAPSAFEHQETLSVQGLLDYLDEARTVFVTT